MLLEIEFGKTGIAKELRRDLMMAAKDQKFEAPENLVENNEDEAMEIEDSVSRSELRLRTDNLITVPDLSPTGNK